MGFGDDDTGYGPEFDRIEEKVCEVINLLEEQPTLRQRLAGMALQGMLANADLMNNVARQFQGDTPAAAAFVAQGARIHADALIAELSKEKTP